MAQMKVEMSRFEAKRINFSVIYGIGPDTLAENLNISRKRAREYLDAYHKLYPGFRRLYRKADKVARSRLFIQMFSGRRRHFNYPHAEFHKASSNLVQGAVAEMIRIAQTRIHREMAGSGLKQRMQIHDSIVMTMPRRTYKKLIPEVQRIMEDTSWCNYPHRVDVKVGPTWGSAKEYKP
ncbi:hypothetical protein LCGC14_2936360, partial [marine sediment metagenome]